jgi:hypothetical protein
MYSEIELVLLISIIRSIKTYGIIIYYQTKCTKQTIKALGKYNIN